ncbi:MULTISPECIES: nucleotide exchange factor GrpE [Mycolicibacter]|uniref:Protein GrpE n=1 Tax=Mycolicibacter virginiensis TaxID=1795032 RepID=A0A9X7IM50_9MYCO|nr:MULTISPECIES: nucleotide exchange factor GrpE [Mycobacteriaceae]OBG39465.1 nucleotide exchange factor GrpE [Mycolicibacter heraklionensis]OBJ34522.1 nucleotide exchange factor GrpE [Mycolicibacter heraklionensis]PQM51598.1 nucleotide exchange factor GrpE [Mycolicibacter virginiensis]ULP47919.1 nucleotide exchange factor GrpE [Mycolicibacter virginiensis]
MSEENSREQSPETITVTDKRRIDPETGEVRESSSGPAPSGPAPEERAASDDQADQVAELTADLQRVQADFANYRKRALRDQQGVADRAKAAVVTEFLGILDDLDRARSHGDLEAGPLKAVADKLTGVLTGMGLTSFGAEGDEFDPSLHEAVQHEGDGTHSVIGTVLRQGYKLGEQVLRHAMVGVVDTVPDAGANGAVVDGDTAEEN